MPLLYGDTMQNDPKIFVLGRERIVQRIKIRPYVVRRKVSFFYGVGWVLVPYTG